MLGLSDDIFSVYAFYATIVILKTMLMSFLTAIQRFKNKTFANPEDVRGQKLFRVGTNENVERVRRNHLNDLENVPMFLFLAFIFLSIGPTYASVLWHCRLFVGSRMLHTLAYQLPLPQPSRALAFFVGVGVNVSMAVQIIRFYM